MKILKYILILVVIEFLSIATLVAFGVNVKTSLNYALICLQNILNN